MRYLDRRRFLQATATGAAGLSAGMIANCGTTTPHEATSAPNILFIITDQQNPDTIAAQGCRHAETPAMDYLTGNGMSFDNAYCPYPLCSPSRAAMFTGRTSSETGVFKNEIGIRSDFPNMGQWLRQNTNYETLYAGKWHVPATYTSEIPGFDVLCTGLIGQGNFCDTNVSMACDAYLRNRSRERPFLMVASFMQPHDICEWLRLNLRDQQKLRYPFISGDLPELPPNFAVSDSEPEPIQRQRRNDEPGRGDWSELHWRYYLWSYYRHIEMVDSEIGRIISALRDTGQIDNTLVLFTADHGEGCAHHRMVRKSTCYDESARVPFIISWPGMIPENRNSRYAVSGLDIMPTICDYSGIEPPPGMKGLSLRPLLENGTKPDREYIALEASANIGQMIRSEHYKYVTYKNDPTEQLFNMSDDPLETVNLVSDAGSKGILEEHRSMLGEWIAGLDVGPDVPDENRWMSHDIRNI